MNKIILFFKSNPNHDPETGRFAQTSQGEQLKHLAIVDALNADAAPWRHLNLTHENWQSEFPDNQVVTPVGIARIGENQYDKLHAKQRGHYFGVFRPTLESPTFVVSEVEPEAKLNDRRIAGQIVERQHVVKFYRAFNRNDRLVCMCCVSISRDSVDVVISAGERKLKQVAAHVHRAIDGIGGDAVLWATTLATQAGIVGRENSINEPVLKAIIADHPAFIKSLPQSITLLMPSGNRYTVAAGDYSFDAPLAKAATLAPGERWLTVHPNGPGTVGQAVLVQEDKHGSGVYRVIGGAGGKLNYLKIRDVKPESSYKQQASEKAKEKANIKKKQLARDKELGLNQLKGMARDAVRTKKYEGQKKFIRTIAGKMGWSEEDLTPNIPEGLSRVAQHKLLKKHHSELLKRAHKAVDLQIQNLVADADARSAAGIVPIANEHTPDDQLTTADLEKSRPSTGRSLGFNAHYAERAEGRGASEDVIKKEADQKKELRQSNLTNEQRDAIKQRGDTAKQIQSEVANIREPVTANIKAVLANGQDAAAMIMAQKELKALEKVAQAANKDIDESNEAKAYNLEVSAPDEDSIVSDIENDLRTVRTKAFLDTIKKEFSDPEKQLRQHIGAGAFNSVNGLSVAATGAALVDRSVVDVLGLSGAAQVLARRLHADLPADEVDRLTSGMEDYHLQHYMATSQQAMQEAKDLHDTAKEIGLGDASHGADFEAVRELNTRRKDCIEEAHKVLGTALGEMEANAALVTAMKAGRTNKPFEVPLGKISDEDAIRQARALGLERGDYKIDTVAGTQIMTITPEGLDKLASPIDKADMERTRNTLSILNGEQDEDDWLPQGFANRPDLAMNLKPGVAATLARAFTPTGDLQQSLKDYIGGRTADGDAPADIMADIQTEDFYKKAGDNDAYREALDAVAPLKDKNGKRARAEALTDTFNEYADGFVGREYGGKISTLQRQNFATDAVAQDALHRALSDEPAGIAAYKPIGELTTDDQRALREHFYKNVAHESPDAARLRERLERIKANEPEKESVDMFGETSINPDWYDWQSQRDTLAEEVGKASLDWPKYTKALHGHENAYAAMQDMIRSNVAQSFNEHYNKLNPNAPLKLGRQVIRHNLNHLDAIDPEARELREAEHRQLIDGLRERAGGKYAAGSVTDKIDAAREAKEAFEQSQMGFFSTEQEDDMFGGGEAAPKPVKPLKSDERHTLGHAAERTIAGMVPLIGHNFKPGQPVKLYNPTMSGPNGIMRQRSIKFIEANKRVALAASTGAGKTAMFLGSFSHLQSQGKVKRGLFLVPSIVQGQVGAEALRFMEPGRFNWNCEPGASREERIAAHKNPDHHFTVMTHQSFRDDMLHLGAQHAGITPEAMTTQIDAMTPKDRSAWMKGVMEKEGIHYDFTAADEAHNTLNRAGKDNSAIANVIDATTANTPYFVHATADIVKNDISEAGSVMAKLEPEKHGDTQAFMRRYGVDTVGAKDALKREMINNVLPYKIDPPVRADRQEIPVTLSEKQNQALATLDKNIQKVRTARMEGKVNVDAMRVISPGQFADTPEDQHEELAKELAASLGIIKGSAVRAILDSSPDSAKLDALAKVAGERKGKSGVVFAHSLEAVENIKRRLEADGHKVMTLTGGDSSKDKAAKIRGFNPDKGNRSHDILVASDAGATGANLQSGQWLTQFDTPMTSMVHAQRNGRIHRIGQQNNVELLDLVADHASERSARERLKTKYALRELMSSPYEGGDDTGLASFLHNRKVDQQANAGLF